MQSLAIHSRFNKSELVDEAWRFNRTALIATFDLYHFCDTAMTCLPSEKFLLEAYTRSLKRVLEEFLLA